MSNASMAQPLLDTWSWTEQLSFSIWFESISIQYQSVRLHNFRQIGETFGEKFGIPCKAFGLTLFGGFGDRLPAIDQRTKP